MMEICATGARVAPCGGLVFGDLRREDARGRADGARGQRGG